MSLVNIKNFVIPVTNPVHLVSIGVVALMFLILRLSGGGITINTDIETPKLKRNVDRQPYRPKVRKNIPSATDDLLMDGYGTPKTERKPLAEDKPIWESERVVPKPRRDATGRSNNAGRLGSIDDMLSGSGGTKRKAPKEDPPKKPDESRGKGLAEIEKSLGLL